MSLVKEGLKVKIENTDYIRDMNSKAVLNTDVEGLRRYKTARKRTLSSLQEMSETKERLQTIEQELLGLKQTIRELATLRSAS
jgi:hypothetical protein